METCKCGIARADCPYHRSQSGPIGRSSELLDRQPTERHVRYSGKELLQGEDPELLREVLEEVQLEAAEARHDVKKFFEFVMRTEHTGERIRLLPHHRAALDFILHHDRSVNMWPVGAGKTWLCAGLTLFLLGQDPTRRGAIVSATQSQSSKILGYVMQYIETSAELALVFPDLKRSTRKGDPWTTTAITVERPYIMKDASLTAVGRDSKNILGTRLNWLLTDDLLNEENTGTKEQRDALAQWFDGVCLARLDRYGTKVVVTNTPWNVDDLCHRLERDPPNGMGWASMRMQVYGDVVVKDDEDVKRGRKEPWDSEELRPKHPSREEKWENGGEVLRLADHSNEDMLWDAKYPREQMDEERRKSLPVVFNQKYMAQTRDDATAMCKVEWLERCKKRARERGVYGLVSSYFGDELVFTGVDLAFSKNEDSDDTCFFTFAVENGVPLRRILEIDVGKYDAPTILAKLASINERLKPMVIMVENVAAQQFAVESAVAQGIFNVRGYTTGRTKGHAEHGVPQVFAEIHNGAWLIPNAADGSMHPAVERWCNACLNYKPSDHTDDTIMAQFFAREQAKAWGVLSGSELDVGEGGFPDDFNSR